jgi:hypothetical protein
MNSFPVNSTAIRPVSSAGQAFASVLVAVALIVLVTIAVRLRKKRGTWIGVILLLSTFVASSLEVTYNAVSNFWYYKPGQTALYSDWGRSFPVWALCSYAAFYGGIGMLAWWLVERGAKRWQMIQLLAVVWLVFVAAEIFFVGIHVYEYYGRQPFRVAGFPIWPSLSNATICLAIGICAARLRVNLRGRREWGLLTLGPLILGAGLVGTTFPTVNALHANHPSSLVLNVSAILTLGMAAAAAWLVLQLVPEDGLGPADPPNLRVIQRAC